MSRNNAAKSLQNLSALRHDFSSAATTLRKEELSKLKKLSLADAKAVLELHELLVYARALPQDAESLALVEDMLEGFAQRPDLRRHKKALADTGIAGTDLHFRFYWLMAIRLLRPCADDLHVDWLDFEHKEALVNLLHLLLPFAETTALDGLGLEPEEWIESLKGPDETDAAFLIQRFQALRIQTPLREKLYEDLDIPMRMAHGPHTPNRSREKWQASPIVLQNQAPSRKRPDLRRAIKTEKFRVQQVKGKQALHLIDLANACMVPRHRDLLIFLYASEQDIRMIDFGDGLQFACFGAVPERRLVLESVYGFITLMNGVPMGYVLCSALGESSEIAYNVFETFRGAGAAKVYARILAMVHGLFGSTCFAVDPYQLGHNNEEGLRSGAWWFYYKLGFRPRNPEVRALVQEELATMQRDPKHRTKKSRLNNMASAYMYLNLGKARRDVLGELDLGNIGLHASHYLAQNYGSKREAGIKACAAQVASLLQLRSLKTLSPGEQLAWERWAPLVLSLPGMQSWSLAERRSLRDIIRAKGGQQESVFVTLFDGHRKLRAALLKLSEQEPLA